MSRIQEIVKLINIWRAEGAKVTEIQVSVLVAAIDYGLLIGYSVESLQKLCNEAIRTSPNLIKPGEN